MTFSDFGRQVAENRTRGTDHGDASVLFVMGGAVRPGLLGAPADLGKVHDGGLDATVDFRQIYANVLEGWLHVDRDDPRRRTVALPVTLLDCVWRTNTRA